MQKAHIVILAAGKGKRMKSELPKAVLPLKGKPIISYLLDAVKKSGVCEKPVIVVGYKADEVKKAAGSDYFYVYQDKQLGTGHAVECAKGLLHTTAKHILILYSDQPLIRPETIQEIVTQHIDTKSILTMATITVPDFESWREPLYSFGRVVRNSKGEIKKIVELKDANKKEKAIKELNPSYFCFQADWLWKNIHDLKNNNAQKEYYLTDLVERAIKQGHTVTAVAADPKEAMGVNTKEQLKILESLM